MSSCAIPSDGVGEVAPFEATPTLSTSLASMWVIQNESAPPTKNNPVGPIPDTPIGLGLCGRTSTDPEGCPDDRSYGIRTPVALRHAPIHSFPSNISMPPDES